MSESTTKQIKLSLSAGQVGFSVQTQNVGEAEETIPASYDGEEFNIGYNATYLLELLRTMKSEEVLLAFQGPTTAGVFTPVMPDGDPNLLCLVMPLRLPGVEAAGEEVTASSRG